MPLRLQLLGEVAIAPMDSGLGRPSSPSRQGTRALVYLSLHRLHWVTRDELADALWGDGVPASWETSLRVVVSKLRAMLDAAGLDGSHLLRTERGLYRLELPAGVVIDVEEARALVTSAESAFSQGVYGEAAELAARGAAIASVTLLTGEDAPWIDDERRALDQLRLHALELQGQALLSNGDAAAAARVAIQTVAGAPLRESAHQLLISAHAAVGNRAEALRAYEACRVLLADELGVDPSPRTQAVYLAVLRQDLSVAEVPSPSASPRAPAELPSGTVTFLFTDIEGSTRLAARLGQAWNDVLNQHRAIIAASVARHGGSMLSTDGDGCFCAFTTATDAVGAAVEAQRGLTAYSWSGDSAIRVRMGLHTGAATPSDGDYSGVVVHSASRIMAAGHGGQILLSSATAELVVGELPEGATLHDLGVHLLKDLAPRQLWQLGHPDLVEVFPPLRSLSPVRHNLPAHRTSFVGRSEELADIVAKLRATRLLTLVAPGGAGKTRLAFRAAAEIVDRYPAGVWAVELAALDDADLVPSAVAGTLGLQEHPGRAPLDAVAALLGHGAALLVLDNCEHVVGACAELCVALLDRCPELDILATSREPLLVAGESILRVGPLSLPEPTAAVQTLLASEAVSLFAERARSADPAFALGGDDARVVAEICIRLDGLPLAIELAASRTRILSVSQIAERLDDRFRLLTGGDRSAVPRQRTLRALIDWSHDLLDEQEAAVFRRLAVFAGSIAVEAAEEVCSGEGIEAGEVLDLLDQLSAKSLITTHARDEGRGLHLLETIRAYAAERLDEAGEADHVRARHAGFFVARTNKAAPALAGAGRGEWLARLADDNDNLRAALAWAVDHDPGLGLVLAGNLGWFWYHRGQYSEGRAWLSRFLTHDDDPGSATARTRALTGAARLSRYSNAVAESRALAEEAVVLARSGEDREDLGYALYVLGLAAQAQDDHAAIPAAQESVAVFRQTDCRWGLALALFYLGTFSVLLGEDELVLPALQESQRLFEELEDHWGIAGCLYYRGVMQHRAGDLAEATTLVEASVEAFRASRDRWRLATALDTLADLHAARGRDEATLRDEAATLRGGLGIS